MKRLFLPALALIAALFATFSILRNRTVHEPGEPPSPPPVSDFSETVAAIGLVEASSRNVEIGTPLAGVVAKVLVDVGQDVKTEEPLFQLDIRHLEAELAVRRAALASAEARESSAKTALDEATDQLRRAERLTEGNVISSDELVRRKFALQTTEARAGEARAGIVTAEAQLQAAETDIERSTVRAPFNGTVLQVNIQPGQFAGTGQMGQALLVLGNVNPLHVRVDIDEHEGWRVKAEASAVAHVRGNPRLKTPLKFVRFEPLVIPKRSLTGNSIERVDTRVLQVIYEVIERNLPLFVGQQMDVFIEDTARSQDGTPAGL